MSTSQNMVLLTLFFVAFMTFLGWCMLQDNDIDAVRATSPYFDTESGRMIYETVNIEGCQYVLFRGHAIILTDKGNCTNEIHCIRVVNSRIGDESIVVPIEKE